MMRTLISKERLRMEIDNQIDPVFEEKKKSVIDMFFSRDANYWSFFKDSCFSDIVGFRKQHIPPEERVYTYPHGEALKHELMHEEQVPEQFRTPVSGCDDMLKFAASLSKDWENPASVFLVYVFIFSSFIRKLNLNQ